MTERLTDERLAELRTIAEAATPGAWEADGLAGNLDSPECRVAEVGMWREVDAEHIAAFDPPTAIALVAEVERLREERDKLQARLDRIEALHAGPELIAVHDGYWAEYRCNECRSRHWPCPTVKAARGGQS